MPIDYERAKREGPKLKAALTRAMNTADKAKRRERVIAACRAAVKAWAAWGAWPDNWHSWNIALQDATGPYYTADHKWVAGQVLRLEDFD